MKFHSICAFWGIVFISVFAGSANAIDYSAKKTAGNESFAGNKANATRVDNAAKNEKNQEQKNLDLSLPDNNALPAQLTSQNSPILNPQQTLQVDNNLLEIDQKNDSEGLHLKGGLLLSPYQEAEKQKLVDGARIIFSLRR